MEVTLFILHIGKHKSGSSSIQNFLALNAEKLEQFGVLYPQIGRAKRAHHGLVRQIEEDLPVDPGLDGWNEVRNLGEAHPEKKIVISSEGLETLKKRQIAQLPKSLYRAPTLILIYVRDLAGLLPSKYNQLTKKGINIRDFDGFYARYGPSRGYQLANRIERWADVFGWENLRIRSLDSRSLAGGDLIEDLVSILGVSLADLGPDVAGLDRSNVSLGWKATELLRALYTRAKPEVERESYNPERIKNEVASRIRRYCVQIVQDLKLDGERTQYLTREQREECDAAYSREILKLNKNIVGPKLPLPDTQSVAERLFVPTVGRIPAEQRAEIGRRLAVLLELEPADGNVGSREFTRVGRRRRNLARLLSQELRESLVRAVVEPGVTAAQLYPDSNLRVSASEGLEQIIE